MKNLVSVLVVFSLILGYLVQGSKPIQAQAMDAQGRPVMNSELSEVLTLFRLGRYDDLIEKANLALAGTHKGDPNFLYWRGYAERLIGWFDVADKDLAPLGDFKGWPTFPTASHLDGDIRAMLAQRPIHEQDIVVDNHIAFRAYYTEDEPFTRSVLAALPQGYRAAAEVLGTQKDQIPVIIFNKSDDDYQRFVKFFTLLGNQAPHSWWKFLSTNGTITLSQRNADGVITPADAPYLSSSIAHEMTHVVMQRTLGHVSDFPNWFNEGLAQLVAAKVDPPMLDQNDRDMQRLLQQQALLSVEQLTNYNAFHEVQDQVENGKDKSSPYAQGMSMTRYLGGLMPNTHLGDFLNTMRDKGSFTLAVRANTGLTVTIFYDHWLRNLMATTPTSPTQTPH